MSKKRIGLLIAISLAAYTYSVAQSRVGAQIGYGTEFKGLAGINGEFFISQRLSLSPSAAFYVPQSFYNGAYEISYWELNADAHFYFMKDEGVYALGGLSFVQKKITSPDYDDYSDGVVTINLGLGANFGKKKIHPFFEFIYKGGWEEQFIVCGGVRFDLNKQ